MLRNLFSDDPGKITLRYLNEADTEIAKTTRQRRTDLENDTVLLDKFFKY